MDNLTIERLTRGYNVNIEHTRHVTDEYELERLGCADRFEVLAEVLLWLGWDAEAADDALDVLDDEVYVLTDEARAAPDAGRLGERVRRPDIAYGGEYGAGDGLWSTG